MAAMKVFNAEQIRLNGGILSGDSHDSDAGVGTTYKIWYRDQELAIGPAIPSSRSVIAGDGLVGGGNMSADITIDVNAGSGLYVTDDVYTLVGARDKVHIANEGVTTYMLSGAGTAASPGCVTNAKILNPNVTISAGNGIQGGGTIVLGGASTINVKADGSTLDFNGTALQVALDGITKDRVHGDVAGSGLAQQVDGALYVLHDDATLDIVDGTDILKVKDAGVNTTQLADSAVTAGKLATNSVITNKILDANVTNAKLQHSSMPNTLLSGLTGTTSSVLGVANAWHIVHDKNTLSIGVRNELKIADNGVGNTQLSVNYAASASQGGDANAVKEVLTQGDGVTAFSYDGSVAKTVAVDATVVRTTTAQTIAGVKTFSNNMIASQNLTVQGNLTVNGAMTSVVSNEVNIGDSIILLNSDIVDDADNANGGIEVKRLLSNDSDTQNASLIWNNSSLFWEAGYGGSNYEILTKKTFANATATLSAGTSEKTISHGLTLSAPPTIMAILETTTNADDVIGCTVVAKTNSAFTVSFSAPIPNANFKLDWVAIAA